jgi:beta-galactosidase
MACNLHDPLSFTFPDPREFLRKPGPGRGLKPLAHGKSAKPTPPWDPRSPDNDSPRQGRKLFLEYPLRNIPLAAFLTLALTAAASAATAQVGQPYTPPTSPRQKLNFNLNWKFIKQDVPGADAPAFDDSTWSTISTPHTYNDTDTFNKIISHGGGQAGAYSGLAWYRKHFKLPADDQGKKIVIEFEGMRQAATFFLNGKKVGLFENGVTAYGLDISDAVHTGDQDNVLAVQLTNSDRYLEQATNTGFQWESKDFNPNYGGIHDRVWLHVMGGVHQTLPLYEGLQTTGTYIYPSDITVTGPDEGNATINVETEVANDSGEQAASTLSVAVVDPAGKLVAQFDGDTTDQVANEKDTLHAAGKLEHAALWSPAHPSLYTVYTLLTVNGNVVDVQKTTTGFRKADFRGGAGKGGVYINDQFTWLTGYAQRSTDEWAGLGQAYPTWMHDFTAQLLRDSHGNYMRWMHISPQRVDVEAYDKAGRRQGKRPRRRPMEPAPRRHERLHDLLPQQPLHPLLGNRQLPHQA